MKTIIFTFLIIIISQSTLAGTKEEQRTWLGLFGRKNIATQYDLWAEVQLRHDENNQTMGQTLNRFGVLRSLNDHHEIGFLFAYVQSAAMKEYRPTLQYIYKTKIKANPLSIRNRIEGRDIEDEDADSIRFRTSIRYAHVINQQYEIVVWDEPFFNLTHEEWTGDRFVERNRAFIGTKINFEKISFEVGYMNQYVPRKTRNLSEHILVLYAIF